MGTTGRHVSGALRTRFGLRGTLCGAAGPARRLGVTALVAAAVTITAIATAIVAANPTHHPPPASRLTETSRLTRTSRLTGTASTATSRTASASSAEMARANIAPAPIAEAHTVSGQSKVPAPDPASAPLALTALDRRDCPTAAAACVDLTHHITWLQADGKVTFGPVRMEPGKPGSAHATPRGTFHVAWKAGPTYMSTIYHEPMPWATFFAVGGIAFHGGSLTAWSHGCVHLTIANAHYYNEHLPIGAEVVVF